MGLRPIELQLAGAQPPVSYTHLDVYKRQGVGRDPLEQLEPLEKGRVAERADQVDVDVFHRVRGELHVERLGERADFSASR